MSKIVEKNITANIANAANDMALRPKWLWIWPGAMLILPWQIRWFSETPTIGGYPWEQGRLSIYLSWALIAAVICGAIFLRRKSDTSGRFHGMGGLFRQKIGIILLIIASFFTLAPQATVEWWIEVLWLVGFVWALMYLRVSVRSLAMWFVLSLIPYICLGFYQFATQVVVGSKWLGIAFQHPLTPGVAVIQVGVVRWLRAYGGFPHPNIFGGWLTIALLLTLWLTSTSGGKKERLCWMLVSILESVALVLTFSRSAWLATVLGLIFFVIYFIRQHRSEAKRVLFAALIIMTALIATGWSQRSLLLGRIDAVQTLEQRSMDERIQSLQAGWQLFLHHPFFGVGPGATAFVLQSQVVPHVVWLLLLDEIGLVGCAGMILLLWSAIRSRYQAMFRFRDGSSDNVIFFTPLLALGVISFFDHYLWSLWSGRSLVAMVIALVFLSRIGLDRGYNQLAEEVDHVKDIDRSGNSS